jgi:hypothetical protein
MDHKQKAQELVAQFEPLVKDRDDVEAYEYAYEYAKQAATILVNEVIEVLVNLSVMESGSEFMNFGQNDYRKVLEEIQKLEYPKIDFGFKNFKSVEVDGHIFHVSKQNPFKSPESEIAPGKDIDQKDNAGSENDDTL